ncbi:pyridoxamine 5'-phosphate oxidase family protein [Kitasatospora aureofaciens]|uniref:pyridoxamine 5'-phosphate oxidase family protein n=1 Tax=Kitasatospora aureofaciens TaxID=1894 RepID=UPI001C494EAE|nr:pyridoxamine 5'-phosphate oxidase family protein [Kitasatospora aureofaciens]MBV6696620.1 pyridoxamine 5'-phosphate oxidase family protein [Kitasatospora aureofaciens]
MEPDHIPTATPPPDEQHWLRLLSGVAVGRVVYTVGALPAVLPIRYRLGGDGSVLLRAAARSELVRAVSGALVAFEAGQVDERDGTGWSVTVLGRADVSADPAATGQTTGQVSIRIRPELVTGRLLPDTRA